MTLEHNISDVTQPQKGKHHIFSLFVYLRSEPIELIIKLRVNAETRKIKKETKLEGDLECCMARHG